VVALLRNRLLAVPGGQESRRLVKKGEPRVKVFVGNTRAITLGRFCFGHDGDVGDGSSCFDFSFHRLSVTPTSLELDTRLGF